MAGPVQTRLIALAYLLAGMALPWSWQGSGAHAQGTGDTAAPADEPAEVAPVEGTAAYADLVLDRYAAERGWGAEFVRDGKGDPEALRLLMPGPPGAKTAGWPGSETGLPVEPASYRKRFKSLPFKSGVAELVSFRSIEVGWTAGEAG